MESWLWHRDYALGVEEPDRQRRELVRLVNHWCSPKSREAGLLQGFDTLLALMQECFQAELALMAASGRPALIQEEQVRRHRDFLQQLAAWRPELPCLPTTAENVRAFMMAWLEVHFLEDGALSEVMPAQNCPEPPAPAEDGSARSRHLTAALYRLITAQAHLNQQLIQANAVLGEKLAQRGKALSDARSRLESEQQETTLLLGKVEEAQRVLIQTEKMAAIGQLAAGMSHEINNPVGYILSNFSAMEEAVERLLTLMAVYERYQPASGEGWAVLNSARAVAEYEFLPDDLRDILSESRQGLDRIKHIVQNLKDFSHVDESDWQDADLNQCVTLALNLLQDQFIGRVKVEQQLSPIRPVHCVPAQINQVLLILLNNAMQALPEGMGHLAVRTGSQSHQAWFEVEDDGRGMGLEVQHRIFEPFYTTRPVGQGTGLGLSLAWDIVVQRHGGSFDVTSEPGAGTRMRVWLPFESTAATGAAGPNPVDEAAPLSQAMEQPS